jgi:hypothetical protein
MCHPHLRSFFLKERLLEKAPSTGSPARGGRTVPPRIGKRRLHHSNMRQLRFYATFSTHMMGVPVDLVDRPVAAAPQPPHASPAAMLS